MTDPSAHPGAAPGCEAYAALERQRSQLAEAIRPANKAALFSALASLGIARVVVAFDGSGDSGQIEAMEAFTAGNAAAALGGDLRIPIRRAPWDGSAAETHELTLADAIEALAYDLLAETHGGWEDNEGAYGEFSFDVASQTITLEYNERVLQTEYYEHEF